MSDSWNSLTFTEKVKRAECAKIGEVWVSNKTGREATVKVNDFIRGVYLQHASGRVGFIQQHYFAGDYTPKEQ